MREKTEQDKQSQEQREGETGAQMDLLLPPKPEHPGLKAGIFQRCGVQEMEDRRATDKKFGNGSCRVFRGGTSSETCQAPRQPPLYLSFILGRELTACQIEPDLRNKVTQAQAEEETCSRSHD